MVGLLGGLLGSLGGDQGAAGNAMLSTVSGVASSLGVDASQASASLASMLPELINHLTPNGKIEAGSNDLLSQGLSMLKGLQGK